MKVFCNFKGFRFALKKISVFVFTLLIFLACFGAVTEAKEKIYLDPDRTWVALLSMEDYPENISDLPTDFIDIKRLKETFMKLGVDEKHFYIHKGFLSAREVNKALQWLTESSGPGDFVVFYIHGHGGWIKDEVIWEMVFPYPWKQLEDRHRILMVMSCYSGELISFTRNFSSGMALSSSGEKELSWVGLEEEGLPIIGSVWVYYLTRGVFDPEADSNQDGMISLEEAHAYSVPLIQKYMAEKVYSVEEFRTDYNIRQNPKLIGQYPNPVLIDNDPEELILYRIPQ